MSVSIIPWVIVGTFAMVFLYASVHEYMRWRREGPVENPRDAFEFDEEAPSYEAPSDEDEPEGEDDTDHTTSTETDADIRPGNAAEEPHAEDKDAGKPGARSQPGDTQPKPPTDAEDDKR